MRKARKLFVAEIQRVQLESHAKFGAKGRVEEKNAAKRKVVSVGPTRLRLCV